ncbi:tail fiber protein [Pseudomonas juntendi]|uniref:tail fiber protein n=1 Tax=Pseudomonas juntendi TaxID=2666183 RepID=UPI0024468640|nr:tail fiber protein [Pseudomonas juntendi]MDG9809436.1 tail fiber protein [Pseudomonas juntendi]
MYDPLIINPAMTLGGKQAAFAASASGMSLKLTHAQFGIGMYDPTGAETALKKPVGSKVTLAGGARPTQYQIRMLAAWREDLGGETPVTEIGYYAGNVLAFIWSNAAGEAAFIKTDGVPAVLFSDIGFESVPAGSVDITVDPAEQVALAALAAHESASNAHPQYVEHALFPDAQADLWMTVTGSANALLLASPLDVKVPAYKTGQAFRFKAAYSSTGPVSANINGLGAKSVVKAGGTVLAPGDLRVGAIYDLIYDGARFQLAGGVGGGQFYVEWPTVATANQTKFSAAYTPGSEMVFVNGSKLAKDKYTATDGSTFTLSTAVAAGVLVTMVAYSTFAVADTYTKAEYQSFVATLAQAQNKTTTVVDRWMSPNLVHAAITARVQPSLYDTTAGSLLVPGSFGAGATKLNATASIDNLTASGTYGWGTATTGRPVDGESGEVIHMTGDTASYATQLVTSHTSKRAWLRRKNNNVWATVELYTSDNQLSIGTSATEARTALELGTAAQADLTLNNRDSTVGRVLRVGDFGLGTTDLPDLQLDLDTLTATGFYLVTSSSTNMPLSGSTGMVIVMTNANKWTQQIFMPQSSTRMFQRASNNGVWSAWTEVWNSNNLEKTTSNADATLGRMLKVGDYGIGSKALMTNNLVNNIDDVTMPNGKYAVSNTTTGTKPTTYGILMHEGRNNVAGALGRVAQTYIDVEGGTAYPRIYHRLYIAASNNWGAWYEDWHAGNLIKTSSNTDTTAGRMVRVGDYGLGAQLSVLDANDAVVSGFYRLDGSYTNSPVAGSPVWILVQVFNSSVIQYASVAGVSTADLWIRKKVGNTGVWGAWAEVAKVGDYGLGAKTMSYIANIDDHTLGNGWYSVASTTTGTKPLNASIFGVLLVSGRNNFAGSGGRVSQTFYATDGSPRVWNRTYTGTSATSEWSAWVESWHSGNLVKTEAVDDATPGRMLKVGDFGLGSGSGSSVFMADCTDCNTVRYTGWTRLLAGCSNAPSGFAQGATMMTVAWNSGTLQQVVYYGYRQWQRQMSGTSWTVWMEQASVLNVTDALAAVGFGLTATANAIPSGANLNDYNTSGAYGQSQSAQASLSLNYPVTKAGTLFVQNGGSVITTQIYQEYDSGRIWNRARYQSTWSSWSMCWDSETLVKTSGVLDTTAGRMLKVGDYGIGTMAAPKTVINSNAEWGKPGGWSGFIDVAASKAKGAAVPVSITGATPTYGMWQIVGRRDTTNGFSGIFTDYASGRMWIGYAPTGGDAPVFKELFSEVSVSSFAQTLLDDTSQAAAQSTLGIPALINTLVYGITTKDISGNANVTLTATEAAAGVLWFTGALTGNVDVIVPAGQSKWTVYNRTTGNYTLRVKTSSGVGQYVPQNKQADLVNGGTNLYFGANAFPDATFAGEVTITNTSGLRLIDSTRKYGTIWRNDGAFLYLLMTDLNDPDGSWSTKRPLSLGLGSGQIALNEGATTTAPPAARDSSTRIPNSAWVQGEIEYNTRRYTGVGIGASGNYALTAAEAGRWLNMTGVGSTATLPASGSIGNGLIYQIRNQSSGVVKVVHAGGGSIQQETGNNSSTLTLQYNEWVEVTSSGTSYWITGRGKLEESATVSQLGDRVGEIAFFAGETVPDGFLKRNGAAVSRTTYKALFDKIGTKFGVGDGSTTFNLPDDRGLFIRGWSDGSDIDSGRVFGSIQTDQNASHTHTGSASAGGAHSHTMTFPRDLVDGSLSNDAVFGDQIEEGTQTLSTSTAGTHSHTLNINASGGDEARPINRAYLPCIKY